MDFEPVTCLAELACPGQEPVDQLVVPGGHDRLPVGQDGGVLAFERDPTIAYGAALSAILAVLLVLPLAHERRPAILASVAAGAITGPVAWNAILRATNANQFSTDTPIPFFPISWQDTGSDVFALTLILGFGVLRAAPGRQVALLAGLGAPGALLVDIYLY